MTKNVLMGNVKPYSLTPYYYHDHYHKRNFATKVVMPGFIGWFQIYV